MGKILFSVNFLGSGWYCREIDFRWHGKSLVSTKGNGDEAFFDDWALSPGGEIDDVTKRDLLKVEW